MTEPIDPCKKKRLKRKAHEQARKAAVRNAGSNVEARSPPAPVPTPSGTGRFVLRFEPMDTWFFRESRPHNAVGAFELASIFPPPPRTIAGAMRTLVGEKQRVDWADFQNDKAHPLRAIIGYGDDLGPLLLDGPWLVLDRETLFPAPAFLLTKELKDARIFQRLTIGKPVTTDLSELGAHLLEIPGGERGFVPLENAWMTAQGLSCVLAGGMPGRDMLRSARDLYTEEPRLGIARVNSRRTAAEHMLYQTSHVRPRSGLAVALGVRGLDPALLPTEPTMIRLGGEGRAAILSRQQVADPIEALRPQPTHSTRGLILILLTPADLNGNWLPFGFQPEPEDGCVHWRGRIAGVELTIHAAVLPKAHREGGWDQAAGQPRAVRSLIPAGSAWYCTTEDLPAASAALHGQFICDGPRDRALGRGRLAVGLWLKHEFHKEAS